MRRNVYILTNNLLVVLKHDIYYKTSLYFRV